MLKTMMRSGLVALLLSTYFPNMQLCSYLDIRHILHESDYRVTKEFLDKTSARVGCW